jgi:oxygen-independent coproporphyrinogen III oxidase
MPGIYIHIPFCNTKCIYCDFYSITDHSAKADLLNCIIKEVEYKSPSLKNKQFDTIFFGGGTPSLLTYDDFSRLFDSLYSNLTISKDSEITIEANPGTLNIKKLDDLKKLPVNRLSFGVQSFNDDELKFLTRIHSGSQAAASIKSAQDAGFNNINLDLIFALPNQTAESWQYSLDKAIELNTQHISAYSLIYEEGTVLFDLYKKKKVEKADENSERMLYDFTMKYLPEYGFKQYEISNYSKTGYECRHNLKYWRRKEYIGFGPSAASFIGNKRWVNLRNTNEYIKRISSGSETFDFREKINKQTAIYEYIFLGLRSKGVNLEEFSALYNINFEEKYANACSLLLKNNLAQKNNSTFRLTPKGYAVCDEILAVYF